MKQFFKFDSDASLVEKIATVAVPVFVVVLMFILFGSCLQFFNNDISKAVSTATSWQHNVGFILMLASGVWFFLGATDRMPFKISNMGIILVLVLLVVFSVLFYTGFYAHQYK